MSINKLSIAMIAAVMVATAAHAAEIDYRPRIGETTAEYQARIKAIDPARIKAIEIIEQIAPDDGGADWRWQYVKRHPEAFCETFKSELQQFTGIRNPCLKKD